MVIHELLLVALQAHPLPAVTVIVPVAAADVVRFEDVGEIVDEQGTPDCVTVNVAPAIVRVPDRPAVLVFAATANETVPGPLPAAPAVTVIHGALLTAVHPQLTSALTVALPEPPAAARVWLVGETVGGHGPLKANVFDRPLGAAPPGPTALTTVSYTTPGVRAVESSAMKSTRIMPSASGVGFPRFAVCSGEAPPARYTSSV